MAIRLPSIILLCLLLSGVSLKAFGRPHSGIIGKNIDDYHQVACTLSNPYEVFIRLEKHLITSRADDISRQKDMTPEQRKRLKERRKRFESLSPEAKKKLKDARKKFKQLSPEERKRLKQKWRDLPPEERNKIIHKKP